MKNIKQGIKMLEHIKNFCVGVLVIGGIILLSMLVIYFPHIMLSLIIVIVFIGASYSIGREIREN
ncbi:hypothetical protein PC5_00043 [Campylobacter phage PC5]|uniref:Uncharacterized protein n=1 Tax=Campylobacter phage PC5 TaxID=1541690 RepID=A0A1B0XVK0_9CAUD|nr:hypothetical protein PC5_00043 [Campylobacter phage PC5]